MLSRKFAAIVHKEIPPGMAETQESISVDDDVFDL
jgi:hypothetical protein